MNAFTAPYFQDAEAARAAFEAIRWPNGPICGLNLAHGLNDN